MKIKISIKLIDNGATTEIGNDFEITDYQLASLKYPKEECINGIFKRLDETVDDIKDEINELIADPNHIRGM